MRVKSLIVVLLLVTSMLPISGQQEQEEVEWIVLPFDWGCVIEDPFVEPVFTRTEGYPVMWRFVGDNFDEGDGPLLYGYDYRWRERSWWKVAVMVPIDVASTVFAITKYIEVVETIAIAGEYWGTAAMFGEMFSVDTMAALSKGILAFIPILGTLELTWADWNRKWITSSSPIYNLTEIGQQKTSKGFTKEEVYTLVRKWRKGQSYMWMYSPQYTYLAFYIDPMLLATKPRIRLSVSVDNLPENRSLAFYLCDPVIWATYGDVISNRGGTIMAKKRLTWDNQPGLIDSNPIFVVKGNGTFEFDVFGHRNVEVENVGTKNLWDLFTEYRIPWIIIRVVPMDNNRIIKFGYDEYGNVDIPEGWSRETFEWTANIEPQLKIRFKPGIAPFASIEIHPSWAYVTENKPVWRDFRVRLRVISPEELPENILWLGIPMVFGSQNPKDVFKSFLYWNGEDWDSMFKEGSLTNFQPMNKDVGYIEYPCRVFFSGKTPDNKIAGFAVVPCTQYEWDVGDWEKMKRSLIGIDNDGRAITFWKFVENTIVRVWGFVCYENENAPEVEITTPENFKKKFGPGYSPIENCLVRISGLTNPLVITDDMANEIYRVTGLKIQPGTWDTVEFKTGKDGLFYFYLVEGDYELYVCHPYYKERPSVKIHVGSTKEYNEGEAVYYLELEPEPFSVREYLGGMRWKMVGRVANRWNLAGVENVQIRGTLEGKCSFKDWAVGFSGSDGRFELYGTTKMPVTGNKLMVVTYHGNWTSAYKVVENYRIEGDVAVWDVGDLLVEPRISGYYDVRIRPVWKKDIVTGYRCLWVASENDMYAPVRVVIDDTFGRMQIGNDYYWTPDWASWENGVYRFRLPYYDHENRRYRVFFCKGEAGKPLPLGISVDTMDKIFDDVYMSEIDETWELPHFWRIYTWGREDNLLDVGDVTTYMPYRTIVKVYGSGPLSGARVTMDYPVQHPLRSSYGFRFLWDGMSSRTITVEKEKYWSKSVEWNGQTVVNVKLTPMPPTKEELEMIRREKMYRLMKMAIVGLLALIPLAIVVRRRAMVYER